MSTRRFGWITIAILIVGMPACSNKDNSDEDTEGDSDTSTSTDTSEDTSTDTGDEDDDDDDEEGDASVSAKVTLKGAVDKGPFVLGSSIAISPVDSTSGSPSGQVFNTQTKNDLGEFEVEFQYLGLVSLEADGFYYNESTGALSNAPITLRAYYEVTSGGSQSAYVNLITHLTYNRVKTLIVDSTPFLDAVGQAESELRLALEIGPPDFDPQASGTEMNITGGANLANAYLFAVSAVLAERARLNGGPIDAALQELLNTIAVDFADDGDIKKDKKDLIWEAQFSLDVKQVTEYLVTRLSDIGSSAEVPNIDLILDLDRDGAVNAEDCLIYDPTRWDGNADLDSDGIDHFRCGGDDYDDNCAACTPTGTLTCGEARDHDHDGVVDELLGCGECVPGTPHTISSFANLHAQDIFVVGDTVFTATGDGLGILDASNLAAVSEVGHASGAGQAKSIFVYGDYAYIATDTGFDVFDISNENSPSWVSAASTDSIDVFVSRDLAFVPGSEMVYDVTNPEMPMPVTQGDAPGAGEKIFVTEDIAVILGLDGELMVIDINDPIAPVQVGNLTLDGLKLGDPIGGGMFVANFAVFLAGPNGLTIVDLANPAMPALAGEVVNLGGLSDVFVVGNYAYVIGENGLFAIDVTSINSPVLIAGPTGSGFSEGSLFVSTGKAYVGSSSGLHVIDLDCGGEVMVACGNAKTDWGEECDDEDFDGQSCGVLGFDLGDLVCNSDCTIDSSACTNCGNNQWDMDEECDGTDFNGSDCMTHGFGDGTLQCTAACKYDTSGCYYVCGDWRIDPGEECERNWDPWGEDDLNGQTCQNFGYANGPGLRCDENCDFDPSGCMPVCGNALFEPGEDCEGEDLDGATCADFGFIEPAGLGCAFCEYDISGCTAVCGNSVIEPSEDCEAADLNDATCQELGYVAPEGLACASCQFDDTGCTAVCGNGAVEPGEECDDNDAEDADGCSSACEIETGWQCLGNPSVCHECAPYHHGDSCDQCIVLVNQDEDIAQRDGTTWETGFENIEDALGQALLLDDGCEVWVRAGIHRIYEGARDDSLELPANAQLYGGFDGTESARSQRDVEANETVIEGRGPGKGVAHVRVVLRASMVTNVLVDGFTIRGGRGDPGDMGSGAHIMDSDVTFVDCAFEDNISSGDSGAVYAYNATLKIEDCTFNDNEGYRGGALYVGWSQAEITDCVFTENHASDSGGGIFVADNADVTVTGSHFIGNHGFFGGAICNDWQADLTVIGSRFEQNKADDFGGAIHNFNDASLLVVNSVFIDNESRVGGGVSAQGELRAEIVNCTLAGNLAHDSGGGVGGEMQSSFKITNTIIWDNEPNGLNSNGVYEITYSNIQGGFAGTGNIQVSPLFVALATGDVRLSAGSPCIDAADGEVAPELDIIDFPRYDESTVANSGTGTPNYTDMGAYEYNTCGNDAREVNEPCDGVDLNGNSDCQDIGFVASGSLSCTDTCAFDISNCVAVCGNSTVEPTEDCESGDLDGATCQDVGFSGAEGLACAADCTFDISGCTAVCGDDLIEPTEDCEGHDLNGTSCESEGFQDGLLSCKESCSFDYSECNGGCGNGTWEEWYGGGGPGTERQEECDGQDLGGSDCMSFGYQLGAVSCTEDCKLDTSACVSECNNGWREPDEECDQWDLGVNCEDLGFLGGGELMCTGKCEYNTASCNTICGNAVVEPAEDCEDGQLGGATCQELGYAADAGVLTCSGCEYDSTGCSAICGNSVIEPGEECEDGDLDSHTCKSFGYVDEAGLDCASCALDSSGCTAVCGNGVIEPGEDCDDDNVAGLDGCSSICEQESGWQCLGQPSNCDECLDFHHGENCDQCVVLVDNDEAIVTRNGMRWDTALASIQEGIDAAESLDGGCQVWVAAGTHYIFETSNNDTYTLVDDAALYGSFAGTEKSIDERKTSDNRTILDARAGEDSDQWVNHVFSAQSVHNVVIDGFVVKGAGDWDWGGGLVLQQGSATVRGCAFTQIETNTGNAGAIYTQNSTLNVESSVFFNNQGGAIQSDWAQVNVTHCSFTKNNPQAISLGPNSALAVVGSIIWDNNPDGIQGSGSVTVEYSAVQGYGAVNGNVLGDPLFVDADEGDLRLETGSPCIDAADGDRAPEVDKDGFGRYDDPSVTNTGNGAPAFVDMGALERHVCGNEQLDTGEQCEGDDLGQLTCQDLGFAAIGDLTCLPTCRFDQFGCVAVCGNSDLEPTEDCDGVELGGLTCQDLGYVDQGTLACNTTCEFDTSGCAAVCGNSVREPTEECEGDDLNNTSCMDHEFDSGDLSCNGDCTFNYLSCNNGCGNEQVDWNEECDGENLSGQDCGWFGYSTGEAVCAEDCKLDISDCGYVCGNNMKEGEEECDGWDTGGQDCTAVGYVSPGNLMCLTGCTYDTSGCVAQCGNGIVEPTENCEVGDLDGADCTDLGFGSAAGLACTSGCEFDISSCTATCGNSLIEPTEECEGANLNGKTCRHLGYVNEGDLGCTSCGFDDSGCSAVCGNAVIEPGETCDDGNGDSSDGCSSTCEPESGWQCLGEPSRCDDCDDFFHGTYCDQCIVLVDNNDSISVRDGKTWETALATVQDGIDQAAALDANCQVWVAGGTYYLFVNSPNDTIQLESGVSVYGGFDGSEGSFEQRDPAAADTILDGRASEAGQSLVNHIVTADWISDVTFEGFTLQRGGQWDWGGGIWATNAWLTVSNCVFQEIAKPSGNTEAIYTQSSNVEVYSSVFYNNNGGGVRVDNSEVLLSHCTFVENNPWAVQNDMNADTTIVGCIIWDNSEGIQWNNGTLSVTYSDVQSWGTTLGNLNTDPLFVDPENGDLRLQSGSPCIDAADGDEAPDYDINGYPRYDDPTVTNTGTGTPAYADMGAFEVGGCGNGTKDSGEDCDGDVGVATCTDLGYVAAGALTCLPTCRYNTALCKSSCGNLALEPDERCESGDVGDATCQDLGYKNTGSLGCDAPTCTYDSSGCAAVCENDLREPGEACDGDDLGTSTCNDLGFNGGGPLSCNSDCTYNMNMCWEGCGNNSTEGHIGEECDGTDLMGSDCGSHGLCGELACGDDCKFDMTSCSSCCGNESIEFHLGEVCDGDNLNGQNCSNWGMTGTLQCDGTCQFDLSLCV